MQHARYHVGEVARQCAGKLFVMVGGVASQGCPTLALLVIEIYEDVFMGISVRDGERVHGQSDARIFT